MTDIVWEYPTPSTTPHVLIEYCISSVIFTNQGQFYKQIDGAVVGSPLSPLLTNMYVTAFMEKALVSSLLELK
jgi:hypothetical protein